MKKIIIILGIILTSGVAALALTNNHTEAQANADKKQLIETSKGREFGAYKNDIANAD